MQRRDYLKQALILGTALGTFGFLPALSWSADHNLDANRLWGRIWDANQQQWLNAAELQILLLTASNVVVGERHDNPQHHRLERVIVDTLAQAGKLGGVAMEMLNSEQQALIAAQPNSYWRSLNDEQLQSVLAWQKGWDWEAYGPIIKRVFELDKPLLGANLLDSEEQKLVRTKVAPKLPESIKAFQQQAIIEGHCGLLPEAMIDGMLAVQIARDLKMANALASLAKIGVLVCGAGHARRDVGVSQYMGKKPLTIGLIEVTNPLTSVEQAQPDSIDDAPAFDIMWFTPPQERDDPCASLRKRFTSKD